MLIAIAAGAWWLARPTTRAFYSDGVTIRETVRGATKRDVLWQPPMKLAAVINTTAEDYEPRLSWDENTLYLVRGKRARTRTSTSRRGRPVVSASRHGWTASAASTTISGRSHREMGGHCTSTAIDRAGAVDATSG